MIVGCPVERLVVAERQLVRRHIRLDRMKDVPVADDLD
jgi:hypothetical protein